MNDNSPDEYRRFRPIARRDPAEPHRAATPLELLFDLVSVIAIAAAAAGLHHAIAEHHVVEGIVRYLLAFFAIWWAWMNYSWYASAYDNDDTVFRILTMLIMTGSLVMAAGIAELFDSLNLAMVVIGYVIMRLGLVVLWLRAAAGDPIGRQTALAYAIGITVIQVYWVTFALNQPLATQWFFSLFALGVFGELMIPVIAENRGNTPWHRHHMIERYGLLNIIVLGETLLAASIAIQGTADHFDWGLVRIALSGVVILFAMWWLYFSREEHLERSDLSRAFVWGYGHYVIYAAGAAVGAGIAVSVDVASEHADVTTATAYLAIAIPLAAYQFGLWLVRDLFVLNGPGRWVLPGFAVLVLALSMWTVALEAIAVCAVACTMLRSHLACSESEERAAGAS